MISPTKRQMDVLRFVTGFQEVHDGVSPSFQQMADETACGSKSRVTYDMICLERQGFIRRMPNRARAIEVLHPPVIPRDPQGQPLYFVEVGK